MRQVLVFLVLMSAPVPGLGVEPLPSVETHCVATVIGQEPDGEFITAEPICFDERAEVGKWVAQADRTESGRRLGLDGEAAPRATFTLGIHFDGAGGTGSSISVVGSSCTGGYWNTPSAWDNRISSSYNGCAHLRHWDLPAKGGSSESTAGAGTTKNLTTLNNKAESVSYHSS